MEPLEHALGLRVGWLAHVAPGAEHAAERLTLGGQRGLLRAPPAGSSIAVPEQQLGRRAELLDQARPGREQVLDRAYTVDSDEPGKYGPSSQRQTRAPVSTCGHRTGGTSVGDGAPTPG